MFLQPLEKIIEEELKELGYETKINIRKSNRPDLCDYQCDNLFQLAKQYHQSPIELGEIIEKKLFENERVNHYANISFVKPGFLNIILTSEFINEILSDMQEEHFHLSTPEKEETFFLDYGGPNVAKPLHVGHLRSAVVGESIKRIIEFAGHKTVSDVHLGDYGLQIGQVIYGIIEDKKEDCEITLEYLEELYPKVSGLCKENEEILEKCATITKELQDGNSTYQHLWKIILKISGNDIKRLYQYLDVHFDVWKGESDAYSYIESLKNELQEKNLLEESNGAKIIPVATSDDKKEIPPLIFEKSNGAYLYGTTDLATIKEREELYHPDHYIYIADLRQSLHFEQVFRVCEKASLSKASFEFCGFGTVNGTDGKPFKTRKGDAPKLDSLFTQVKEIFIETKETNKLMSEENIDKIVNAILKFADLQNNRERNYIFDIAKFSEVVGKTGPYVLYTYVRLQKLLDNVEMIKFNKTIYNTIDRNLRLKLLELPTSLESAFNERMPHYIADYIYDLCVEANNFYQNNRMSELDGIQKEQWQALLALTNRVLKEMLKLLVIDIPTEM